MKRIKQSIQNNPNIRIATQDSLATLSYRINELLTNETTISYWHYSLYSTPSESLTDRFCRLDTAKFGKARRGEARRCEAWQARQGRWGEARRGGARRRDWVRRGKAGRGEAAWGGAGRGDVGRGGT